MMNKNNAKDYLLLVQALADGKVIQHKVCGTWYDRTGLDFTDKLENYRIKPEPMDLWVWYNGNGTRMFVGELKGAEAWRMRNKDPSYYVKQFIEVM